MNTCTTYPAFYSITYGASVTVADLRTGARITGQAVALGRGGWVIMNMGRPTIATPASTIKVN